MNTNNIIKYNELIEDIVKKFTYRFYNEGKKEITNIYSSDYRIINYVGINQGPVEISDMFLLIDDILIAEMYQIPIELIIDWYDYSYDDYKQGQNKAIDLYNYWRKERK